MKVLFIGMVPLDSMGGDAMESHVMSTLQSMGVETEYFAMFGNSRTGNRVRRFLELAVTDLHWMKSTPVERSLLARAREFGPDMVLVLLGNYTAPVTIHRLREAIQAPVVCWCQDHMGTMGRQYLIGSRFDYLFAKDQMMVDLFRSYTGLEEVHYLPEACNPDVHKPLVPTTADMERFGCEVTTAGTLYYFRAELLTSLSDFDMKIWGPVPRFYQGPVRKFCTGEPVFTRDKAACFNAARIVVNTLFPMELGGINARAFEVAGCGGFQLISENEAVSRHFRPGTEIETFRNLDELREKVVYYLEHEDSRRAIADAGRARAHAEHTYRHRLSDMFAIMGMSPAPAAAAAGRD